MDTTPNSEIASNEFILFPLVDIADLSATPRIFKQMLCTEFITAYVLSMFFFYFANLI